MSDVFYSTEDIAEITGLPIKTIQKYASRFKFAYKICGSLAFTKHQLARIQQQQGKRGKRGKGKKTLAKTWRARQRQASSS